MVQKGLQISESMVVVSRRDGRGLRCSGADSRDHGAVRPSGYESSCIGGWHAALPDCSVSTPAVPFFGGVFGDARSCGGVGGAAASVSVGEGIFSVLVYRSGLLAGWWDAGVSVAWTFVASERTLHRCKACFTK